jgi:glycosyltransferase involved in cell wall biosynthesis
MVDGNMQGNSMNILFIHEVDWMDKVVFEMHNLSEILSKNHRVFAIDYEEKWKNDSLFDMGTLKTREFRHVSRAYNGADVTVRRPGMIKLPLLSRLSAFFTHYYEIKKTIKEEKIDAIVLYSAPTNGLQTLHIAKKYNIPVIFRSIDILNQLVPQWFLRIPTRLIENVIYKNVDRIVAITPKLSDYVAKMGADEKKVELLFTGVDTNKFNSCVETTTLREKLDINRDDKVIVFIGTLFDFSGVDQYVEQFPKVLKEFPEAKLVIVGHGDLLEKLKKLVNSMKLNEKVILTGYQSYEMMPRYINLSEICINPFQINNTTRDIMPCKILQYLACGKPVLATPLPGMKAIIPNEDYGVIYSDIDEFAENTVKLLRDDEKMRNIGEKGMTYVKKKHGWNEIAQRLEAMLIYEVQHRK